MEKGKIKEFIRKNFFIIKIFTSIILGFLPSFLFIALFVQYGSPFSNYIKFLLDLNSSSGAWISALVMSFFAFFIISLIASGEKLKKILSNKPLVITLFILLAVSIILISVQLSLYVNFTLRNDVLVELSSDKENIFFTDETDYDLTFKTDLAMNPFCSAECEYEFFDISEGKMIDEGSFNTTTIISQLKTYTLKNNNLIEGSQELKRFEVSCRSKKTLLCFTSEQESKRAILITVNYILDEEDKIFKNDSRNEIINMKEILYFSDGKFNETLLNIKSVNNLFSTGDLLNKIETLSNTSKKLNVSVEILKNLWLDQNFDLLRNELPKIKNQTEEFRNETEELRLNIIYDISLYNNLSGNFSSSRMTLEQISQGVMPDAICEQLKKVISDYNNAFDNFKNTTDLQNKKIITEGIVSEVSNLYNEYLTNNEGVLCALNETTNPAIIEKINIFSIPFPPIPLSLTERDSVCCLYGKCEKCCEDRICSNKNYPIIFLHGQAINEAISTGYSFDTFSKIKTKLNNEGYIDAGAIVLGASTEEGLWGKINSTMIMTGSYFFDTYKTETGEKTISSNQEGIDTYAIRLKNLIELVKYKTNKDKVILAAHSMGGVVVRRYIQVFGGENVEKAILVTVPNHGIEGKIRDYCAVIGPEISCRELDENSFFMNQLNKGYTEKIPVYNFIGIGCDMGDETGEGFVKNSSQYLDYATNYYFEGTCNELNFEFFHEFIINPDLYPEVYDRLYEILKNSSFQ
ncbi:MAG: hypothetical protein M1416_02700 [Candidatus Pacearchaeota archaeon]|nr:hypothetical protein [Candidatus Pacearchaeota archaeon]